MSPAPFSSKASLRQAAILLSALPKPELAAILKRLEPVHAASLAGQLTHVTRIDSAELNNAVGRFLSAYRPIPAAASPEPENQVQTRLDAAHQEAPAPHLPQEAVARTALDLLEELPLEQCLRLLEGEDAAFVAAVVYALSPKKAAAIAERIPINRRVPMFLVLASIEELSPATLAHMRQRLERKLEFGNDLHMRPEGLHRARHILELLNPEVQRGIADALAVQNPQLASELHRNVFRFNDLVRLHRHDLEKVLRIISPPLLASALRHADPRVRAFALTVLPAGKAHELERQIDQVSEGVTESTEAQQQIVDVVNEMFRRRVISRPRNETAMRPAA